ncbi:MAG: hypothetical protein CMG66_02205 [Candidatus Marinimicrobia bacterium]|nr:hypothetical protein [Candidatus Neomarinimicrobiota bacterium]
MIKLKRDFKIQKVEKKDTSSELTPKQGDSTFRPEVVNAKVYKVKSAFVKNAVFITLSYVDTHTGREPIEIFINSKDLNRSAEYVVLTRLISAIFRRASDPMFILEELHGIHDPNGGSFKDGKYFHSFYAEVADVIERFFYDVNILSSKDKESSVDDNIQQESVKVPVQTKDQETDFNKEFRICPTCSGKSLKTENGCDMCVECGYSKCDK